MHTQRHRELLHLLMEDKNVPLKDAIKMIGVENEEGVISWCEETLSHFNYLLRVSEHDGIKYISFVMDTSMDGDNDFFREFCARNAPPSTAISKLRSMELNRLGMARCWYCNKEDKKEAIKLCRGCAKAKYCSLQCHKADWKVSIMSMKGKVSLFKPAILILTLMPCLSFSSH